MNSKEALENWYNTESPATKAYEYELHYRIIKKRFKSIRNTGKSYSLKRRYLKNRFTCI